MSTRLTLHGERVALAPEVTVVEQAVESVGALWRQRMRWAEGSLRRLMELGPPLVANRALPLGRRLDFVVFIGEFVIPPLFAASIIASLLTVVLPRPADWTVPVTLFIGYGLGTYLLALAGLAAAGERSLRLLGRSLRGALFLSHWLLVVPAALLRIALWPPTTDFARTATTVDGGPMSRPRASLVVVGPGRARGRGRPAADRRGDRDRGWTGGQRRHARRGAGIGARRGDAGRPRIARRDTRAA